MSIRRLMPAIGLLLVTGGAAAQVPSAAQPPLERERVVRGEAVRRPVKIVSVNPEDGRGTFEAPAGVRSIVPQDPRVRAFASGLRPGGEVDVTWVEALAIRVQPARRR
jgi:hypothetical protein